MRKLKVFNQVTLDGYFTDEKSDMSVFHKANKNDAEWNAWVAQNAKGGGVLVFGRKTFDMMKSYWPTPQALKDQPVVAERMNSAPKIVFSRTLNDPGWNNTTVVKDDIAAEVRKLKDAPGDDMVIMGSGSIIAQLASDDLIDEYQIVVYPIVLGKGRTMFDGVKKQLSLKPTNTKTFGNGNIVLFYERAESSGA